jgi:hypothetical protein
MKIREMHFLLQPTLILKNQLQKHLLRENSAFFLVSFMNAIKPTYQCVLGDSKAQLCEKDKLKRALFNIKEEEEKNTINVSESNIWLYHIFMHN